MAANTTVEGAQQIIAHLQTETWEVALYKMDVSGGSPTEWEAAFVELSGDGYARQPITLANAQLEVGVGLITSNQGDLTFGPSTAPWAAEVDNEKIVAAQVFNTTTGLSLWRGVLPTAQQMHNVTGQTFEFKAGTFTYRVFADDA